MKKTLCCTPERLTHADRKRTGAATVEFALVAPLFLLLLAGIIEFGQAFQVEHSLANAARRGARSAVTRGTSSSQIRQEVKSHCTRLMKVTEADVSVSIALNGTANAEISGAEKGDEIMVSVSVPFSKAGVGFFSSWFQNTTLSSASIVERE